MNDDERAALSRLAEYDGAPPRITEHDGAICTAYVGDDIPRIGEAMAIERAGHSARFARVLELEGNRHARLHLLSTPRAPLEG
ncbi:MAG: hypothetical protein AAGI01_11915, partial [Myxococcota bacterium]